MISSEINKSGKLNPEIIFLFPNYISGYLDYHLGASYIISYLRQKQIYSELFTNNEFVSLSELINRVITKSPRVIGFSCYDSNYLLVKLLCQMIKKRNPDILILVGGPTATFSDKVIMEDAAQIDICVRSEGEQTTYEILQQIKSNKDYSRILGITFRKNNMVIQNPDRPLIKNETNRDSELDVMPSPYLTGVLKPYDILAQHNKISILTARGCIYRCIYCNFSAMSRHTIRYHSVDRIISELRIIKKGIGDTETTIYIMDDAFTLNKNRAKVICQYIIKEKLGLNLWVETRAECVDRELLELLFAAGVKEINFGLESAVPKILYRAKKVRISYEKNYNLKPEKEFLHKIRINVKLAKEIGIKPTVSVIFGLPGETFKKGMRTLNFIKRLKIHKYFHNYLTIFPGTELAEVYSQNKIQLFKKRLLSFVANYSYRLEKITPLKHSFQAQRENLINRTFFHFLNLSLMGLYSMEDDYFSPRDIILIDRDPPVEWLEKITALQTRIICLKNLSLFCKDQTKTHLAVIKLKGYITLYVDSIIESLFNKNKYQLLLKTLSLLYEKQRRVFHADRVKIFDIVDSDGINDLSKEINSININKRLNLWEKTSYSYVFIDCCRWGFYCPAVRLKRLIIDANGNIFPCFKARPIGRVGTTLEDLRTNFICLWEKEKLKRGCLSCSMQNRCSKCLFISPISVEEYCLIRREHQSAIAKITGTLHLNEIVSFRKISQKQI